MPLLPDELRAQLPAFFAQGNTSDPVIYARLFIPDSDQTWFVTEGEEQPDDDFVCFGYVTPEEKWGYFSIGAMEAAPLKRRNVRAGDACAAFSLYVPG